MAVPLKKLKECLNRPVIVEWGDAHSHSSYWELGDCEEPYVTWSIGFLTGVNKKGVTLLGDVHPNDRRDGLKEDVGGRMVGFIPMSMITDVIPLIDSRQLDKVRKSAGVSRV